MSLNKILSLVFLAVSIGLALFFVNRIKTRLDDEAKIESIEQKIIDKLKMIREAQIAFISVNGTYTSDWDKLLNFIDSGQLYNTTRTEKIFDLGYGADSSVIIIDTLGAVPVIDSIFNERKYPGFDSKSLPFIPAGEGKKFHMWAGQVTKGNVVVDVVEVKNIKPIDPRRSESSEIPNRKPLRFGSRTNVTLTGNWE